jgi:FixJ family two-component response regulator
MSASHHRDSALDSPNDDRVLGLISAALAQLPRKDRHEIHAFLDFWRELAGEERALFAKSVKADLTDRQIARLVGVTVRTLYRWERFQSLKAQLEGCPQPKRRKWRTADDSATRCAASKRSVNS